MIVKKTSEDYEIIINEEFGEKFSVTLNNDDIYLSQEGRSFSIPNDVFKEVIKIFGEFEK